MSCLKEPLSQQPSHTKIKKRTTKKKDMKINKRIGREELKERKMRRGKRRKTNKRPKGRSKD